MTVVSSGLPTNPYVNYYYSFNGGVSNVPTLPNRKLTTVSLTTNQIQADIPGVNAYLKNNGFKAKFIHKNPNTMNYVVTFVRAAPKGLVFTPLTKKVVDDALRPIARGEVDSVIYAPYLLRSHPGLCCGIKTFNPVVLEKDPSSLCRTRGFAHLEGWGNFLEEGGAIEATLVLNETSQMVNELDYAIKTPTDKLFRLSAWRCLHREKFGGHTLFHMMLSTSNRLTPTEPGMNKVWKDIKDYYK